MQPTINGLRNSFARGENIIELLKNGFPGLDQSDVIELAYDIQSGTYTDFALDDPKRLNLYAHEIHDLCKEHLGCGDKILDCGAGELTTLSHLSLLLPSQCQLLACDISLSRLRVGRRFAKGFMRDDLIYNLNLFVADMSRLPIADSSVDVVFTSHALEPNHGRELELLVELLRVTRRKLLLFEPSWENADESARSRMKKHGYVRDLPAHISAAGGRLLSVQPLPHPINPMNPTHCYVVEPSTDRNEVSDYPLVPLQCPRSGFLLKKEHGYYWSEEGGWAYPEIDGILCLREKHGILMSHY
jgi:hypothetical protein